MSYYKQASRRGVEQSVARRAHNPEVVGSSPSPATIKKVAHISGRFFYAFEKSDCNNTAYGYEHDERCSLGMLRTHPVDEEVSKKSGSGRKNRGERKPDNFFGKPQPGAER